MILHDSIYLTIAHQTDKNILKLFWKEATIQMSEVSYKEEMLALRAIAYQLQPTAILSDNTFLLFPISPRLHTWIKENILDSIKKYFKKLAVIESTDIFTNISVEMTLQEHIERCYEIQYFSESEKIQALEWIYEN